MAKPITSADLPEDLARFAQAQVAAGHFATVVDVLRAGKEALEARQRRHPRKMDELRAAVAAGDASPDFEGDPFASVRAQLGNEGPPLPHDWNDDLRYRFEEGRKAFALGDYSEEPPAELMARVRARVEKNG
jgi:putative addiction module CopG family antidote